MFYKTLQILWNSSSSIPWLPFHLRYFQQFLPLGFFLPICSRSVPLHPQNLLVTCHFPTLRKPQALPTSPWHSLTPKLSLYLFHFLFHCPLQRFPLHQGMNPSQAVPASRGPLKRKPKVWTEKWRLPEVEGQPVLVNGGPRGLWVTDLVWIRLCHSPAMTNGPNSYPPASLHNVLLHAVGKVAPAFLWGLPLSQCIQFGWDWLSNATSSLPKV